MILDANQATERTTGYSIESLRGRSIFDLVHPQDRVRVIGLSRQLYEEPYEAMVLRRDGRCIDLEITGKNLPQPDGSVQRIVVGRDISSRKQAQAQTVFMTQHDLLTGLPNRQHLLHYAEKMLQQLASQKISTALFFINLDHFKTINDSLGHFMGDEVLQTMAQRLKASMRPEDFVARLSGDEFVILLSSVQDENQVKAVAEKLLLTIAAPHTLAGMPISLSPSIGTQPLPQPWPACRRAAAPRQPGHDGCQRIRPGQLPNLCSLHDGQHPLRRAAAGTGAARGLGKPPTAAALPATNLFKNRGFGWL